MAEGGNADLQLTVFHSLDWKTSMFGSRLERWFATTFLQRSEL
jgi:hypothetical protein